MKPILKCAMEMRRIPAGTFLMGSVDGAEPEQPVHEVSLNEFLLDATPVTNDHFWQFVEETGYSTEAERKGKAWGYDGHVFGENEGLSWRKFATPDRANHPVVLVTWNDAVAYAQWAGKRLPTEAEWEKAARGGAANQSFPWGNESPNGTQCNFARKPGVVPPTTEVFVFPPNAFGLYDMVGNVWQWCSDFFADEFYFNSPNQDPSGPVDGSLRIRRGGSWNVIQEFRLRCANRGAVDPSMAVPNMGFRCASDSE